MSELMRELRRELKRKIMWELITMMKIERYNTSRANENRKRNKVTSQDLRENVNSLPE
jgi:hypothetical protein